MPSFRLLHHHARHRTRQLRWVLPVVAVVLLGAVASALVAYDIGDRTVSTEFFRAHKTIHETGQLLQTGLLVGLALSAALVAFVALWSFRLTHRIVRPVHTIHLALDALAAGALGTRVELHRHDEFQEVADALNQLAARLTRAVEQLQRIAADLDELSLYPAARDRTREIAQLATAVRAVLASCDARPRPPLRPDGPADAP